MKLKTLDVIFIILDKTTWIVTSEGKSHFCLRWRYYMWIWRRNGEGKSVFDELKVLRIRVGTIMTVSFLELFPLLFTSFIVPSHYDIFWYNLARDVTFFTTCKVVSCDWWAISLTLLSHGPTTTTIFISYQSLLATSTSCGKKLCP